MSGIKEATGFDLTEPFQTIGGKECTWCAVADAYLQFAGSLINHGIEYLDAIAKADIMEKIDVATVKYPEFTKKIYKTTYKLFIDVKNDRRVSNAYEELDAYTDDDERETDLDKIKAKYVSKERSIKKEHDDRDGNDESMAKFQEKMQVINMARACIMKYLEASK